MNLFKYKEHEPVIGIGSFIASTAVISGNVNLGEEVSVWFNTVIRGDVDKIIVGKNTNIQDLSMLHVTKGFPLSIGSNVTIGHNAIIHGCTIGNNTLIGMGAKIMDGAEIGANSVIAAGSIVPPGKKYSEGSLIIGSPAVAKRRLTEEEINKYSNHYKNYIKMKNEYINSDIVKQL